MHSWKEVVQETDVSDMFSKLEQIYLQDLGIEMIASYEQAMDPEMTYILRDPQNFSFLNQYKRGFILDPLQDMPTLLSHYSEQLIRSATVVELQGLQNEIETNRIRQSIFESDREEEAKGDCVNLFLDKLFVATIARQRQLIGEEKKYAERRIQDIISAPNANILYKKIIDLYQSEFGISLYTQVSDDDPESIQTILRVDDDYKKIALLGIETEKLTNLNSDALMFILESYLKPIIAHFELEDLLKLGAQVKGWHDHLEYKEQMDFELARFIGSLQDVIHDQLKTHIDAILEKPGISMHHMSLIVNHLDLLTDQQGPNDIQNYLDSFADMTERAKLENRSNAELRHIIQTEKIQAYFQRFDKMALVGVADLIEVCELKTYLTMLEMKKSRGDIGITNTLSRLAEPVALGLRQLLTDYQADIESTVSDRFKKQKLTCINKMIAKLDDPKLEGLDKKIEQIKNLFDENPSIHKTESIGRFLYRCLCALFGKPSLLPSYHMILFKGLSTKDDLENELDHDHSYRKLKGS